MAFTCRKQLLCLMLCASMMALTLANKDWQFGFNSWNHRPTVSKKLVVGDLQSWRYGSNYTDWAIKTSPFFLNDTLVFKFDAPSDTNPFQHSVYLLRSFWHFLACDFRGAKMVANVTQGGGEGFEFRMNRWMPYYFACGEHDGAHCRDGQMKFIAMPLPQYRY
ncbi:CUB and sushi domain-containing protein 3 [Tripterygium wilfordii]|uniref:CUB and sushi domain-containing protein 3 n=1 Tax=Tripterygium wilfordii TaxID=458696 RepID=A0A7J7DHY9_TRIWF|nr:uncharacterized protein LOC120002927 [Tripterygium wilfordii]KAF5745676.1 CUB and sushi domain-containing protein 3 [Tripterygium wilfordii]